MVRGRTARTTGASVCVIRYVRPDMEQKVGAADYAMAARGEDRFGNFIHTPAPSLLFAPESLELYDSMRLHRPRS